MSFFHGDGLGGDDGVALTQSSAVAPYEVVEEDDLLVEQLSTSHTRSSSYSRSGIVLSKIKICFIRSGAFCLYWLKRAKPTTERELVWSIVAGSMFVIMIVVAVHNDHKHPQYDAPSKGNADDKNEVITNTSEICESSSCVQLASTFLSYMNLTADPCDDFYEYACGRFDDVEPIPDEETSWSSFGVLADKNQLVLRRILEKEDKMLKEKEDSSVSAEEKAKLYYKRCMDLPTIENASIPANLQQLMSSVSSLGNDKNSLNLDDANDRSAFSAVLSGLQSNGVSPFFSAYVGPDDKKSTENVMQISQAGLSLPSRDYYVDKNVNSDETLMELKKYMNIMFTLYQEDTTDDSNINTTATTNDDKVEDNENKAELLVKFESSLASIMLSQTELRDPQKTYNVLEVEKDLNAANKFGWTDFFAKLLCPPTVAEEGKLRVRDGCKRTPPKQVLVTSPSYLTDLDTLLQTTAASTIRSYLQWRILSSFSSYLPSKYTTANFNFQKKVYGLQTQKPRWKTCVSGTSSALGFALGQLFIDETFSKQSRDRAEHMVQDIISAFESNLAILDWMDDDTKNKAKEKADAIIHKIGYPDNLSTVNQLNAYYADLAVTETSSYMENIFFSINFGVQQNLDKLDKAVDKDEWGMIPPTVNAYYNPPNNEIVFPAGILQAPFYDGDFLRASNYGGIGVVMGHELTHGFDDQGSQYDKDGNLVPWWPDNVSAKFKEKTKCVADEYGAFQIEDGDHVNGNLTLGENIADNGGLRESFEAYRSWVNRSVDEGGNGGKEEPKLPGLPNLTPNQLFFLSFATVWCGHTRAEEEHRRILTDPHSPGRFRVIGTLSNSEDFAREFGCKAGTKMNPENKCRVW